MANKRRNPSEYFRGELPISRFDMTDEDWRAPQPAEYTLQYVLDDKVEPRWEQAAERIAFDSPFEGMPKRYGVTIRRNVFWPQHVLRHKGKRGTTAPEFDVVVAVGVDTGEEFRELTRVGQLSLTIRHLTPHRVWWYAAPWTPSLEGADALRAMGMRWLLLIQQLAARMREAAAEKGVRLNPARRQR